MKSSLYAIALATLVGVVSAILELNANGQLPKCTYLLPVTSDYVAIAAGLFLIIEGFYSLLTDDKKRLLGSSEYV